MNQQQKLPKWRANAVSTADYRRLDTTTVHAINEATAHHIARQRLHDRLGHYGGWTVTLDRIDASEGEAA